MNIETLGAISAAFFTVLFTGFAALYKQVNKNAVDIADAKTGSGENTAALNQQIRDLETTTDTLMLRLTNVQDNMISVQHENAVLNTKVHSFENTIHALENKNKDKDKLLEKSQAELDAALKSLVVMQKTIEDQAVVIHEAQAQMTQAQATIGELNLQIVDLKGQLRGAANLASVLNLKVDMGVLQAAELARTHAENDRNPPVDTLLEDVK